MTIRAVPIGLTTLSATTDTTVASTSSSENKEIYSLIIHDNGGAGGQVVDLYISDDATSAAAERVEQITLAANESKAFKTVALAKSKFLIIQSSAGSVGFHGALILRDGSDAS